MSRAASAAGGRPPLPPGFRLAPDPATRRVEGGTVLVGGSPLRVLRLRPAGARLADALLAGDAVRALPAADGTGGAPSTGTAAALRRDRARQQLARRLLDAGFAHPRPPAGLLGAEDVSVVVPAWEDAAALAATLEALARGERPARVVVVDDASSPAAAAALAATVERPDLAGLGVVLLRRRANGGPGAARTTGLDAVRSPLVAFIDAGVAPEEGWLAPLLAHLADPEVVAVAPRVRSLPGDGSVLDRYERARSPLDLGPAEGRVAPGARVAYVPSALLLVRRSALDQVGGFDASLRTGEDVDLVWRLVEAGGVVRYEPTAQAWHRPRPTWRAWVRQRVGYGRSAGPLDARHPGSVAPAAVSAWSVLAWAALVAGHPVAATAVAGATTALLARKLAAVLEEPWPEALRLGGLGHLHAGRTLAAAVTRPWWPAAVLVALASRRARVVVAAAAVVPALLDAPAARREQGLGRAAYVAARLADDVSYGAGVWHGCLAARRLGPLLPDLRSWPGRSLRGERPAGRLRRRRASWAPAPAGSR